MASSLVLVANAADGSLSTFRLNGGHLERMTVTPGLTGCSTFAVDGGRGFVYASVKPDADHPEAGIVTLSIDRETGELALRSRRDLPGGAMNYLTLTRDGTALLGAAYSGGYGIVCPVEDGAVGEPAAEVSFPRLHSVAASADGRFAYFVSLEADLVAQYALADDLSLEELEPATAPAPGGSGPRHLVVSDAGDAVYVLTEFTAEVLRYDRDPETGTLTLKDAVPAHDPALSLGRSVIDEDPRANGYVWGADLHLGDGVLWASERTGSTLAAVDVGEDGALSAPGSFTVTETQPRGFALSPERDLLVAAGERSTSVSLYAVSGESLELRQRIETGQGANWVRFA